MFGDALGEFAVSEGEGIAHPLTAEELASLNEWIFTLTFELLDETGAQITRRYATRTMITAATGVPPDETFEPLINDPGTVRAQAFGGGRDNGVVTPTYGGAEFNNVSGEFDDWVDYSTDGGKVTCEFGRLGAAYPAEYSPVYICYINGDPSFTGKTMRVEYRGREALFDHKVVTEGFVPAVPLIHSGIDFGGTGVAGAGLKFLLFGTPGYTEPRLLDEIDNAWFLHGNPLLTSPSLFYDGGAQIFPSVTFAVANGATYAAFASPIRFQLRMYAEGGYSSSTESLRRWNIVDLAKRAGITEADAGALPAGSIAYDAGNRVVDQHTYKEVFRDIASFQVASIGFTRLDEFYARPILPSFEGASVYTFKDSGTFSDGGIRGLTVAKIPGLEKRVWQAHVQAGETRKSALAGVIDDAIRDALSRDPWTVDFVVNVTYNSGSPSFTISTILTTDPNSERAEVQITGNEFATLADMEAWALRFMRIHGAKQFACWFEAEFSLETLALCSMFEVVTLQTDRYGGSRNAVIWAWDMQLKRRVIRFGLWSHREVDAPVAGEISITNQDTYIGAGGGGAGSGSTGLGDAAPQEETFVVACGDETTACTTGVAKRTFRLGKAHNIREVRGALTTAATGAAFIFDINVNGGSVLSTKLSVDVGEKTSLTAASQAVISTSAVADDAEYTVDFDQVGSTIAGAGPKVTVILVRV